MSGGLYFTAVSAVLISGCAADYLNHYETVTLATGDTNNAIMLLQTADPFNPNSNNTHIEGDGQRIAGVAQRYRGVAATAGVVPTSKVGLDCAGGSGNNREAMERVKRFRRQPGCHRWPAVPMRLVFVTVAAVAAYITQYAIQRGERVQLAVSNWIGPLPAPIEGRASIIDGDTVEIAGQRIRFNGIDAPESGHIADDAKGFEYLRTARCRGTGHLPGRIPAPAL